MDTTPMRTGTLLLCVAVCSSISSLLPSAVAGPFQQLVVFGDSLSDTGNVFHFGQGTFPPSSPAGLYDNGRLSNGPVWVESLAATLGAPPPTPSLLGGTNFAWGGAQSFVSFEPYDSTLDPDPFPLSSTLSITDQVDAFLSNVAAGNGMLDPNTTLYVVWGGANDFLIGDENSPALVARRIMSSVQDLIELAGAKHVLVPNMPSLLDTPGGDGRFASAFVADDQPNKLDKRVEKFNTYLDRTLDKISTKNPEVSLYEFDVFSLYKQVLDDPQAFGFNANTGIPVLDEAVLYGNQSGPLFLNDPATSLFWDGVHPTALAHSVLAQEAAKLLDSATSAANLVPEPGALTIVPWLLIVGVTVRQSRLRRRS